MTGTPEDRRSRLSAAQRVLLEKRLKGLAPSGRTAIPRAPRGGTVPLSFAMPPSSHAQLKPNIDQEVVYDVRRLPVDGQLGLEDYYAH